MLRRGGQLIRHKIALLRHSADVEERERGEGEERMGLLARSYSHATTYGPRCSRRGRSVGRSVGGIFKEGQSVLHPKNGLRRNTALEERRVLRSRITHEQLSLSTESPTRSLALCLTAESVVVAEKRSSTFSERTMQVIVD